MESPPFWIILLVVAMVLIAMFWPRRRNSTATQSKLCGSCGEGHPSIAEYCRRCGKKL